MMTLATHVDTDWKNFVDWSYSEYLEECKADDKKPMSRGLYIHAYCYGRR
jgi:hypothetical protein